MLSAYVEVLLCVIELLAFVAFKNTTTLIIKKLIPMLFIDLLVCLRVVSFYRKYVKIILSTGLTVND